MTFSNREFLTFSVKVNRHIFEGNLDGALRLIGDYMLANDLTASIETVVTIPLDDRTNTPPASSPQ
ncbi:hypothetical protein [Stappia stellulata]|uniref:hypothetical protein n=1 Tax=Stappia stellulata TaxID=71235 RepID=UPI0004145A6D|nr:hypothetical protein [Stappia stellulata]